ncbi:hypothetical protein D3C73_973210 [compost metagenome]
MEGDGTLTGVFDGVSNKVLEKLFKVESTGTDGTELTVGIEIEMKLLGFSLRQVLIIELVDKRTNVDIFIGIGHATLGA